jgi:starch phosphorylase
VGEFDEWITDATLLRELSQWSDDAQFQKKFI